MAYSQRIADYVCEQLSLGRGLRTIARDDPKTVPALEGIGRMPNESTLRQWAMVLLLLLKCHCLHPLIALPLLGSLVVDFRQLCSLLGFGILEILPDNNQSLYQNFA